MQVGLIDIVLILLFLYLLFLIIYSNSASVSQPTNIIFDDDIIMINSNNDVYSSNEKSNFENKVDTEAKPEAKTEVKTEAKPEVKTEQNKSLNIIDTNNLVNEMYSDIQSLDDIILDNLISKSTENLNIKSGDKMSNRYNRKYNNVPKENDLMHIRNYDIINKDEIKNYDKESVNNNNMKTIQKKNDLDSKIFNKSNKLQKLFKDSKTIAGRFTKKSIIDDYKNELDYYEKLRTPWWVSEAKYD
jgi:hypothetical protein